MISVELYIGDLRVDLFGDENISMNMSIKNFQNLDTVLTDFTQGFTIPASANNNAIMEHWYNYSVTTSFNPATKISGRIELNTIPFRKGVFSLDRAVLKNGRVDYYEITFYGGTANLTKLFGEDYLASLNLSTYALQYSSFNTAIANRVSSNNVLIPLISPVRNWQYKLDTDTDSIKYNSSSSTGIVYNETKPAIRLKAILDAIEIKYGVTFNSTFFNSIDFGNLYMWAHREAGYTQHYSSPYTRMVETYAIPLISPLYDTVNHVFIVTSSTGTTINTFDVDVTITSGTDVVWDLLAFDEGTGQQVLYEATGFEGNRLIRVSIPRPLSGQPQQEIFFALRSSQPATFQFEIITSYGVTIGSTTNTNFSIGKFHFTNDSYTDSLTGESLTAVGNLPQQTVREFMGGLIKMFNLIVEPVSSTEFNIEPLDDYYSSGASINLSKYIDHSETSIKPSSLYGEIGFKFSPSKTILADNFRQSNGDIGYGDLRSVIVDSNGDPISSDKFDIELPFTNIIWEKLFDQSSNNAETSIMVGKFFDVNLKPVYEQPYIFYYVTQQTTSTYPIAVKQYPSSSATSITTYNFCYQWNTKTDSFTHSLNFGSEINPYTYNDGTASTPSLYNDYWKTYITDLYDLAQRRYTLKAILPIGVLHEIQMKDTIVIGMDTYRINSIQVNLTNGEATLDLFKKI